MVYFLFIPIFCCISISLAQDCPKIEGARYVSYNRVQQIQPPLIYTLTECTYSVLDGYNLEFLCDKENFNGQYRVLQSHNMDSNDQLLSSTQTPICLKNNNFIVYKIF